MGRRAVLYDPLKPAVEPSRLEATMHVTTIAKVRTDVPGLDTLTHGGIPAGRTTLIAGRSGTAKSVLSLQIGTNLARAGHKTIVIAVEESPEDLATTGDALGFGVSALVKEGRVHVTDLTPARDGETFVAGEYDVSGLVHRIDTLVKEHGATALVLDSATALFSPRPSEERLRAQFLQLIQCFRRNGLTAIVTAEAREDYGPLTSLGVEDFLCDVVIKLRNLVDDERRRRLLEVHKYRRSAHFKGEYPCTITRKGLTVFPLDTSEGEGLGEHRRFGSGLAGLDDMTNGGWLRDSIVLVRGPAGSGKTTLAGMYARAGALRGERVVYYGFEETKRILLRNFAAIRMPMEELEAAGNLRLTCRFPEATSPEDLLVEMRADLAEYKPSLVVLDSVSSIEHSTSRRGFRHFMVGAAALLREHGRSALLTQTINTFSDEDRAAPYLSTIPDAILLMDYTWRAQELQRTLRVLKMRGSPHATEQRKLSIHPGGLRIDALD